MSSGSADAGVHNYVPVMHSGVPRRQGAKDTAKYTRGLRYAVDSRAVGKLLVNAPVVTPPKVRADANSGSRQDVIVLAVT